MYLQFVIIINRKEFAKEVVSLRFIKYSPLEMLLGKSGSENMQQIYRETPMSKCDFNKLSK